MKEKSIIWKKEYRVDRHITEIQQRQKGERISKGEMVILFL